MVNEFDVWTSALSDIGCVEEVHNHQYVVDSGDIYIRRCVNWLDKLVEFFQWYKHLDARTTSFWVDKDLVMGIYGT